MISSFSISGFRGCREMYLRLSPSTGIIGENGSGKTHILEAIHLASGGNLSYIQAPRTEDAFFEIEFQEEIGNKKFSLTRHEEKDIYKIQDSKVSGVKYKEGLPYRTVFISPFDMNLLYFAPALRRDYIDNVLSRSMHQFGSVKRDYEGTMRQRNALLKKIRDNEAKRDDLDYWDKSFSEKAYLHHLYRMKWVNYIKESENIFHSFLPDYKLSFHYESKILEKIQEKNENDIEEVILQYLKENRERDILTGHTHIGPHLDDFCFLLKKDEQEIQSSMFLSRGENKVLLLTLKQLETLFLRKHLSIPIVLLFDDVFAELDEIYANTVIARFQADQTIITTQRALPKNENWDHFSCINLTIG